MKKSHLPGPYCLLRKHKRNSGGPHVKTHPSLIRYRVTRFCCLSGLCVDCHGRGNHGDTQRRVRITHAENVPLDLAQRMVAGWTAYEAQLEPMQQPGFAAAAAHAKGDL